MRPAQEEVRFTGLAHFRLFPGARPKEFVLATEGLSYTPEQGERLRLIHARLVEARRELDALIGDAYLRPRANIVPVHFLDLAAAVEKLRWAEKEWRELERQQRAADRAQREPSPQPLDRADPSGEHRDPEEDYLREVAHAGRTGSS